MNDYFKEFQKNAGKMWRPFGLMFQRGLLFLMYPLWQAGVLHHHDGHSLVLSLLTWYSIYCFSGELISHGGFLKKIVKMFNNISSGVMTS